MKRLFILLFSLLSYSSYSQSITGETVVMAGQTYKYYLEDDYLYSNYSWTASSGVVKKQWKDGLKYFVSVEWSGSGSGRLYFKNNGATIASLNVSISPPAEIQGPSSVSYNSTHTFTYDQGSTLQNPVWQITEGVIVSSSLSGTQYSAQIKFTAAGSQDVTIVNGVQVIGPKSVNVSDPPLTGGTIAADQELCPGEAWDAFTNVASPQGGNGSYSYQWQLNNESVTTWTDISGATGITYTAANAKTSFYRRKVTSGSQTAYSNIVSITHLGILSPGIIAGEQTVCYGGNPSLLTSAMDPAAGGEPYQYQWQWRSPGGAWSNISGATSKTYDPSNLTSDKEFRRRVTAQCDTDYSNTILVTVLSDLNPGSVSGNQTICSNEDPIQFTNVSLASGSDGDYSYQWQRKADTGSWSDIAGATRTIYDPPVSTIKYDYRRKVESCGRVKYSNIITVDIFPALTPGSIAVASTYVCYGETVHINVSAEASGGDGSYTYSWQEYNKELSKWEDVPSESSATLSYEATENRKYRRVVSSCGQTRYSNEVTITVREQLAGGNIDGDQEVCYAYNPTTLNSIIDASGGDENYNYQWQKRRVGTGVWNDITGATKASYNPPVLDGSYEFQRVVSSCDDIAYSNVVTITVFEILQVGSVTGGNETACVGGSTGTLLFDGAAGGDPSDMNVQWQSKPEGGTWTDITGASNSSFSESVESTTHYRVKVTSCGTTEYTNELIVVVDNHDCENYVVSKQYLKPNSTGNEFENIDVTVSTTYFDDLGREKQTVIMENSPLEYDVVKMVVYDNYGRITTEYLPYTEGSTGHIKLDAEMAQSHFFQTEGNIDHDLGFDKRVFEASPLNRVIEQGAPGTAWQPIEGNPQAGKTIKFSYDVNTATDQVKVWSIVFGLPSSMMYAPAQLTKTITTDEESHQTIEFVDKLGQTILKRVQVAETLSSNYVPSEWADTYYIYDDFGNLRFVLPPMANQKLAEGATIDDTFLAEWAFTYKYDGRNRMIEKRVPGADWVYMVYDNRDRLVLTQDGNQRDDKNEWTFTKYDQLNRPIATGIVDKTSMAVADIRTEVGGITNFYETRGTTVHGYTDQSYPTGVAANDYLTVTYYDDYTFKSLPDFGAAYNYSVPTQLGSQTTPQGTYTFPSAEFDRVKGQVTGSKTKVLDNTNTWLSTVTYYDDRYRAIQTVTENYSGGIDRFSTLYNFPGWMLATYTSHQKGTDTYGIKKRYTYDHAGRLMQGYHQLFKNGTGQGEVLLAENRYNELGELIEKNLHVENNQPHQSIDYRYNIRGWLESVNNSSLQIETGINENDARPDLFGMELLYNHPLNGVPAGN